MFIWDFVADTILGQIVDWIYGQVMGFLGNFFAKMGNMGVELFELSWVQSIVLFFSYLAWALYVTGLVVACFECGIEYSSGRGNLKETALCAIKGFMAVSLFIFKDGEVTSTQSARQHKDATDLVLQGTDQPRLIRRLTPLECERLQGFPDGWTDIPNASDSSRYKALGNSVAIPCVDYVLFGIALVLLAG